MGKKQSKQATIVTNDYVYNGPPIPDLNELAKPAATVTVPAYMTPSTSVNSEAPKHSKDGAYNLNLRNDNHVFAHNALYKYSSLRELTNVIILGYVRTHCFIAVSAAPQDVIDLCLLFYTIGDEWDQSTSDSRLVHDAGQVTIGKPTDSKTITRYYAFGRDTVLRGQQRLWRFKILERDTSYSRLSIALGIIPRDTVNVKSWDTDEYNNDFVYDQSRFKLFFKNGKISNGKWVKPYCDPIAVGDIIEMELDMRNDPSTLQFWINGVGRGVAFSDISKYKSWTLCASFQRRDKLSIIPIFSNQRTAAV